MVTVYSFEKFFEERFGKLCFREELVEIKLRFQFSVFSADRGFVSVQLLSQPTQGPRVHA